ncbi:hypothetical protein C8R43DRAFT_189142 [Mycena crocata]|nr:hypothetical protein C8R43DRAFT_189142 [Mycena crocata]
MVWVGYDAPSYLGHHMWYTGTLLGGGRFVVSHPCVKLSAFFLLSSQSTIHPYFSCYLLSFSFKCVHFSCAHFLLRVALFAHTHLYAHLPRLFATLCDFFLFLLHLPHTQVLLPHLHTHSCSYLTRRLVFSLVYYYLLLLGIPGMALCLLYQHEK